MKRQREMILKVGLRLRRLRQQNKMTILQVTSRAQLSKGLLSKIENGKTVPSLPVFLTLLDILNVSAKSFFDDDSFVNTATDSIMKNNDDESEHKR